MWTCTLRGVCTKQQTNCWLQFKRPLQIWFPCCHPSWRFYCKSRFFPAGGRPASWVVLLQHVHDRENPSLLCTPVNCGLTRLRSSLNIWSCLPLCLWITGHAMLRAAERQPPPTVNSTSAQHHPWCLCLCIMTQCLVEMLHSSPWTWYKINIVCCNYHTQAQGEVIVPNTTHMGTFGHSETLQTYFTVGVLFEAWTQTIYHLRVHI